MPEISKVEQVKKLLTNWPDKKKYIMQIRSLSQVLNHGLVLKKIHKFIKFNQEAWLKMMMVISLLIRFAYMLRNHMNENVKIKHENNGLTNVRDLSNNMQMLIKILKITIEAQNVMY